MVWHDQQQARVDEPRAWNLLTGGDLSGADVEAPHNGRQGVARLRVV
ncbi:hypothetical protein SDC9_177008 [bioreactor metagenome]|uniref:Uncharacterized protein n=1 Tax=bioreactor metagenome TaxID=1076179 RepID=A0A645GS34_9ZZZZ